MKRRQAAYTNGNSGAVLGYIEEAIRLDSHLSILFGMRALIREDMGDLDGALADLNRTLELKPNDPGYYGLRAEIMITMKRFDEAFR